MNYLKSFDFKKRIIYSCLDVPHVLEAEKCVGMQMKRSHLLRQRWDNFILYNEWIVFDILFTSESEIN
jgi:hypothetical protein